MTPTPKTDSAMFCIGCGHDGNGTPQDVVDVEFARELESELARIAAEEVTFREGHNQRLKDCWEERDKAINSVIELTASLDWLKVEVAPFAADSVSLTKAFNSAVEVLGRTEAPEVVKREDAEALAVALERFRPRCEECGKVATRKQPWHEGEYCCDLHGEDWPLLTDRATVALAAYRAKWPAKGVEG